MSSNENAPKQCNAAANQRGAHIPCDHPAPHDDWAHSNREHGLIWRGSVAASVPTQGETE